MTEGEIGTLTKDGRQIGGFYSWAIRPVLVREPRKDGTVYRLVHVEARATRFWVFEHASGQLIANFYRLVGSRLILMEAKAVEVNIPTTVSLNKELALELLMKWTV